MTVLARIRADWAQFRKARQAIPATLLGTLVGELDTKEKRLVPARPLTDAEVIAQIKSFLDHLQESQTLLGSAEGRDADRAKLATEIATLLPYVPSHLSEADLQSEIRRLSAQGADLKTVMSHLRSSFPGRYDGKRASEIAKQVLAE